MPVMKKAKKYQAGGSVRGDRSSARYEELENRTREMQELANTARLMGSSATEPLEEALVIRKRMQAREAARMGRTPVPRQEKPRENYKKGGLVKAGRKK